MKDGDEKLFDPTYETVVPCEPVIWTAYKRRGTRVVLGATEDGRMQVQRQWIGRYKREQTFIFPVDVFSERAGPNPLDLMKQLGFQFEADGVKAG